MAERAQAIDEVAHGPDHPDVARDLNILASILPVVLMARSRARSDAGRRPQVTDMHIRRRHVRLGTTKPTVRSSAVMRQLKPADPRTPGSFGSAKFAGTSTSMSKHAGLAQCGR
jgi:hypothetical protein